MIASQPATTNCGASGEIGLNEAAIPVQLAERVVSHLARGTFVSTAVLAAHLSAFVETSDAQQLADFCAQAPAPEIASTRAISMSSETYYGLLRAANICEKPIEHVIAILLASDPNDLYPDPEPDWMNAEI